MSQLLDKKENKTLSNSIALQVPPPAPRIKPMKAPKTFVPLLILPSQSDSLESIEADDSFELDKDEIEVIPRLVCLGNSY